MRYPAEPANPNHSEHHGVAEAGEERTPALTAPKTMALSAFAMGADLRVRRVHGNQPLRHLS